MKILTVAVLSFVIGSSSFAAGNSQNPNRSADLTRNETALEGFVKQGLGAAYRGWMRDLMAKNPALYDQVAEDQAARHPQFYEELRQFNYENAATLEEALEWATPEELMRDSVDENGKSLADASAISELIENAGLGGPQLSVNIDIHSQTGTASGDGLNLSFPVATARKGYRTPTGCRNVYLAQPLHHSKKYGNAPMPLSLFFDGGVALHVGSTQVRSHGCVHVPAAYESQIYAKATQIGVRNVRVCVK